MGSLSSRAPVRAAAEPHTGSNGRRVRPPPRRGSFLEVSIALVIVHLHLKTKARQHAASYGSWTPFGQITVDPAGGTMTVLVCGDGCTTTGFATTVRCEQ